jgi:hypothetical protein
VFCLLQAEDGSGSAQFFKRKNTLLEEMGKLA